MRIDASNEMKSAVADDSAHTFLIQFDRKLWFKIQFEVRTGRTHSTRNDAAVFKANNDKRQ